MKYGGGGIENSIQKIRCLKIPQWDSREQKSKVVQRWNVCVCVGGGCIQVVSAYILSGKEALVAAPGGGSGRDRFP